MIVATYMYHLKCKVTKYSQTTVCHCDLLVSGLRTAKEKIVIFKLQYRSIWDKSMDEIEEHKYYTKD